MNFSCRCQDKYSYSFTGLCFSVQKGVPPPPRYDKIVLHISLESLFHAGNLSTKLKMISLFNQFHVMCLGYQILP